MDLNLPWALISSIQKRWISEKMPLKPSLGVVSGCCETKAPCWVREDLVSQQFSEGERATAEPKQERGSFEGSGSTRQAVTDP